MEKQVPRLLVDQRVRNRIIELFELYKSPDDQLEYQRKAPVNVFNELFEQWDDWVPEGNIMDYFGPPVFSQEEIAEIESFDRFIDDLFDIIYHDVNTLEAFHQTAESEKLSKRAEIAFKIFLKRGRFDEKEIELVFTEQ